MIASPSLLGRAARGLAALVIVSATLGASNGSSGPTNVIAQFVAPQTNVRFSEVYRLRYLNAKSVATLLKKGFSDIQISVVPEVNGLAIVATAAEHQRIADALVQLDVPSASTPQNGLPTVPTAPPATPATDTSITGVDVVTLHAAIPGANGGQSTSASDIAAAVMQALSPTFPDLHITLYQSNSQLLLTGSPNALRVAHQLIDKLDSLPKLVVLDVTILEVDDSVSKDLGLSLQPAVISTTYTELTPQAPASGGTAPPLLGLQQFTRTPISIGLQLNLLIQNGKAKVIADPKLTTVSGRTASIRAGDNLAILTTTGGSVGTVATSQIVTFNTGVQLDITPVINSGNFVTVSIHPTVNNLSSIVNGVPQISTRDVNTTVALQEGQTLIIGGLIEDSYNKLEQRIPILGYLPLIGPLFTQTTITGQRNELVIMVSPHVIDPMGLAPAVGPAMETLPTPAPLATLAPNAVLPAPVEAPAPAATSPSFIAFPAGAAPGYVPPPNVTPVATPSPPPRGPGPASAGSFVYGQRPQVVPVSGPNDPPRVLYLLVSPQVVKQGTTMTVQCVTTTNVTKVAVQLGSAQVLLVQAAPGLWSATVPFSAPNTSQMSQFAAMLSASRSDGVAATVNIPLTVTP